MARRIFISYQHEDQLKAKGFNLLRWAKNVNVEFVSRHLLDPVDSKNRDYVMGKVKEQIKGSSVTVVLIGRDTANSTWVAEEIAWSIETGKGLVGIKLEPGVDVPDSLTNAGADVLEWDVATFGPAIEAAALGAGRAKAMADAAGSGSSCT
jgi:hypothetical protein